MAGLVLLVLLGRYCWRRLRHWYRNRYRREAATRLQQLADKTDQGGLLTELNRLLKLTALAAFPANRWPACPAMRGLLFSTAVH